jgi:orotidine-5'-phosphate decarboxylase
MNRIDLFDQIKRKGSYLCVGLDTDIRKIPRHLLKEKDPVFAFNKQIIDHTIEHTVAYKPNLAFYESLGSSGWDSLQKTLEYIPGEIFTIADAKRGDIGNTSGLYARTFFETFQFDAVTVAPYMGSDSVTPFLEYEDKWVILLALTSNGGSADFQNLEISNEKIQLFERVINTSSKWSGPDQMMYVVGATKAEMFHYIRQIVPEHFFLVPGVGAQGGDLEQVSKNGLNAQCGLLVNSSRGIIYASDSHDFYLSAGKEAMAIKNKMSEYLDRFL